MDNVLSMVVSKMLFHIQLQNMQSLRYALFVYFFCLQYYYLFVYIFYLLFCVQVPVQPNGTLFYRAKNFYRRNIWTLIYNWDGNMFRYTKYIYFLIKQLFVYKESDLKKLYHHSSANVLGDLKIAICLKLLEYAMAMVIYVLNPLFRFYF